MSATTNYSTAVFIFDDRARAVRGIYENKENAPSKVYKTLDPDIKVGDLVVVPSTTRHNFTTVKIIEVDVYIDLESSIPVDWVVDRVDRAKYVALLNMEKVIMEKVQAGETKKKRAAMKAMLEENMGGPEALL